MSQYITPSGLKLDVVIRDQQELNPWSRLQNAYPDSMSVGGKVRVVTNKTTRERCVAVELDTVYLSSECGRYQLRCRAAELAKMQKVAGAA